MLARRLGRTAAMKADHDAGEGAGECAEAAGEQHGMQADERANDQADGEAGERASSASESGARGSSAAISSFITARTAVADAAPPFSVARRLEKKCLNSNKPRGVAMYLLLVTRQTVDSCRPSSPAISFSVSGFIATSPYSKKPRCRATIASATRWMVLKRCSIERSSQRASCRWRESEGLAPLPRCEAASA